MATSGDSFKVALYRWAKSTLLSDLHADYSLLKLIRSEVAARFISFLRQLDADQQLVFAQGIVKRFHPDALHLLGESLDPRENELIKAFLDAPRLQRRFQDSLTAHEIRLIQKYAVEPELKGVQGWEQSALKAPIKQALAELYPNAKIKWDRGDAQITSSLGRITLKIYLDVGTVWCKLRYYHAVYCEDEQLDHNAANSPLAWWGISGLTAWDWAQTPDEIIAGFKTLSQHFLSALPSLLPAECL